jgi:hypothetical protein
VILGSSKVKSEIRAASMLEESDRYLVNKEFLKNSEINEIIRISKNNKYFK